MEKIKETEIKDIIGKIAASSVSVPSSMLISIMGQIVASSTPNDDEVKKLASMIKDKPVEEVISFAIMTCCNSIVLSLWNSFHDNYETGEPIDITKFLKPKDPEVKA